MTKRGQVTIFVIIALAIVAMFIIYFLFYSEISPIKQAAISTENPLQYISKCSEDATKEAVDALLPKAGYINGPPLSLNYNGTEIAYLCYTSSYQKKCNVQNTLYLKFFEDEIKKYIEPIIDSCFEKIRDEYEKKYISTQLDNFMNVEVDVVRDYIEVDITREFVFSDKEETKTFVDYRSSIRSPLYELLKAVNKATSDEASSCYFDFVEYMRSHRNIIIDRTTIEGTDEIYEFIDKESEKGIKIAIRGCVNPI